jgi:hypothetical protein
VIHLRILIDLTSKGNSRSIRTSDSQECSQFLTHALLVEELPHGLVVRPIF